MLETAVFVSGISLCALDLFRISGFELRISRPSGRFGFPAPAGFTPDNPHPSSPFLPI
jgi:hypothetical protein